MQWFFLVIAVAAEVLGTSALKASEGFSRLGPSLIVVAGYAVSFYFLALVLRTMPIGVAYAVWSGLGVALITLIGIVAFDQRLDFAGFAGIGLIVAGVVVLNLFSGSIGH